MEKKAKKSLKEMIKGRPKPQAPRAGLKASGSRYDCGGRMSRKKPV